MDRNLLAPAALVAAALISLTACGGGSGGDSSSSSAQPSPQQADVTLDGNLYLHGVHVHQDRFHQSYAPGQLAFYFDVFNNSHVAADGLDWTLRRDGGSAPIATGTLNVAAGYTSGDDGVHGTGHDIHIEYNETAVGVHQYVLTIDPRNKFHESKENDNTYLYTVDVPADPGWKPYDNDLHYFSREPHFHDLTPNAGNLDFHFVLENKLAIPVTGLKWRVTCAAAGVDKTVTINATINPGDHYETSTTVSVPPGDWVFEMTLDPDNAFSEANEGNNTYIFHVTDGGTTGG